VLSDCSDTMLDFYRGARARPPDIFGGESKILCVPRKHKGA